MKLQTRKRIFYAFFLLFVLTGGIVILYAEGWRIDLGTFKPEKVGAIFVRSFPDSVQITLNDKPIENQSSFLGRGTFISGLFPKSYQLQLKAQGYDGWTEEAQVLPSLVTEFKYAVLVPQTATNVATSENVKDFFESDDNVVTENTSDTIMLVGETIGNGTIVSHSANFKNIIIKSPRGTYSLYDLTAATTTNLTTILQADGVNVSTIKSILMDPYDDTKVIVGTPTKIWQIDLSDKTATIEESAIAGDTLESPIAISSSLLAWARFQTASNTSQIVIYDTFSGDIVDNSLVVPGVVKNLTWIRNNVLGVLEDNGSLYQYNISQENLSKIADDVKDFYPTDDGTMLAALEGQSIEVFSFTTSDYYRFDLPQMNDVQSLAWYKDEDHLFVQYPDYVVFLDLQDTGLHNLITVSQGTDASYDAQSNSLYVIDQGQKLLRFDFPQ